MKTAVVIRHVAYEGLGLFNRVLELAGYDVIYLDAGIADFRRKISIDADIMIVLGGPVSANDIVKFPYLIDELQLIEYRLKSNMPVLGIGLGAQLMAKALGASVFPMPEREYGWQPVQLTTEDSVLEPIRSKQVMHWHNDTFSLPDGATLLASTAACEVQAFSWQQSLAIQFHAELDMKKFEQWILGHAVEILQCEHQCLSHLREGSKMYGVFLAEQASQLMENWLTSLAAKEE